MSSIPFEHSHILVKYFISTGPLSLLDIGMSYGKIKFIDRDFLDLSVYNHSGNSADKTIIDGMATFTEYKNDPQKTIYDNIYTGNAFEIIDTLGTYEMVVLGDILEHLEKKQALRFLDECVAHSDKYLVICVPLLEESGQAESDKDPRKKYPSFWSRDEFKPFVHPQHFFQYTADNYGTFFVTKSDYIEHRIAELRAQSRGIAAWPDNGLPLREKYALCRENISNINLSGLSKHIPNNKYRTFFLDNMFLEHYRLIGYLSTMLNDSYIFDIGTNLGYSALALSYNNRNKVISYDIVDCKSLLRADELSNIEYLIGDVLEDDRLLEAPLIMLDTEHDGAFETRFYEFLKNNAYKGLLFLDDIHLNRPMKQVWNAIREKKEDITDLGHFTGSGLVEFK